MGELLPLLRRPLFFVVLFFALLPPRLLALGATLLTDRKVEALIRRDAENTDLKQHFPVLLKTDPQTVTLTAELLTAVPVTPHGTQIKFADLTPDLLTGLPNQTFIELIKHLDQQKMEIKWKDRQGNLGSGKHRLKIFHVSTWNTTTAAGALALKLGMNCQQELLAKVITSAPTSIPSALKGDAASVLTVDTTARAMVGLISQLTSTNTSQIAIAAKDLAQTYIACWAKKDADQLTLALTKLIVATGILIRDNHDEPWTLKHKGVLLGALLAGSLGHANKIKSHDERRLWVINSISNLVWASTTLIGCTPIAASITASLAGAISIGVVVWAVVNNKLGVRNFVPKVREVLGHIEFSALEVAAGNDHRNYIVDILETLAWMRATMHVNGLSD